VATEKSWGTPGTEEYRLARNAYMREYRKQEKGKRITRAANEKWRANNLDRYTETRKNWVASPRGRASTRTSATRWSRKMNREGWARTAEPAPCVGCGKLTRWRAQRLAILLNGRTVTRWMPCCRGC
jgi:hypothetical protein